MGATQPSAATIGVVVLRYQNARQVQVRELVKSMLDQMPAVAHYQPASDE